MPFDAPDLMTFKGVRVLSSCQTRKWPTMWPRSSPSLRDSHKPSKAVETLWLLDLPTCWTPCAGNRAGPMMVARSVEPSTRPLGFLPWPKLRPALQSDTGVFVRAAFSQRAKTSMPKRPLSGECFLRPAFFRADGVLGGDGRTTVLVALESLLKDWKRLRGDKSSGDRRLSRENRSSGDRAEPTVEGRTEGRITKPAEGLLRPSAAASIPSASSIAAALSAGQCVQ